MLSVMYLLAYDVGDRYFGFSVKLGCRLIVSKKCIVFPGRIVFCVLKSKYCNFYVAVDIRMYDQLVIIPYLGMIDHSGLVS